MKKALSEKQLAGRKQAIRLVLADCDGVLTDGTVYYSAEGEALKRFSFRDGMGVARLRAAGIETGIITAEDSAIVLRRAEKLKLKHIYLGVKDKRRQLDRVLEEAELRLDQVAYIGDDLNDREIMEAVAVDGLTAAPQDATPEICAVAHYRCQKPGGAGAFREFADWLLAGQVLHS
jgi:3-deoxy-D-manno-octulosonate 8-phosphate phosphatase (KDO 8-P phosphatase)